MFSRCCTYTEDQWLKALGKGRTPWGKPLEQYRYMRIIQHEDDPVFHQFNTEGKAWQYVGKEPQDAGAGMFALSPTCFIWNEDRVLVYCDSEQARRLDLADESRQHCLLAASA